ncbi:MAG TPA: c-type cytochrome [Burkholderiales bacterium]|jgi:sulfide dehydrogenase cytochrome subunit|nr:c-type cytochrome [Burkholderiales bacterium]
MRIAAVLAAALAAAPLHASAQDTAGRNLAAACAICHGTEGRPATKGVIPLAGLPKDHVVTQMKAFRDGKRPATVMHQIAKGYSDEQIDQLASWFAAQKR